MPLRLALLFCLLFSIHCTAQAARAHLTHRPKHKEVAVKPTKASSNIKRRKSLMHEYQQWKGTRYRLGANSHRAIDCSALTRRLYQEAFAVSLPRTTGEQLRKGKRTKPGAAHVGDLVFFKTGRAQKHVGIYIGENRFIHASRRKGVTISQLNDPYWNHRLLAMRQVLPDTAVR